MGLEPTTFCMANARDRSYAFASVRSNHLFAATTGRASEPQRTRANAECSHCSHCDRCDVQLALPGGATPPERPPLTSASVAHQSSVGEDFAASPRDRIYEPYGLLRSGRLVLVERAVGMEPQMGPSGRDAPKLACERSLLCRPRQVRPGSRLRAW
jgi:hypothetical protein